MLVSIRETDCFSGKVRKMPGNFEVIVLWEPRQLRQSPSFKGKMLNIACKKALCWKHTSYILNLTPCLTLPSSGDAQLSVSAQQQPEANSRQQNSTGNQAVSGKTIALVPCSFLSHLLVAGCNIGVRFSIRPSVNIYVDVRHLCQS